MTRPVALALSPILAPILASALATLLACADADPAVVAAPDRLALSAAPVLDEALADQSLAEEALVLEPLVLEPRVLEPRVLEPLTEEPLAGAGDAPLARVEQVEVTLRHGETLVVLAQQAGVTAEELAERNGLDVTAPLVAGQALLVPVHLVSADQLEADRAAAFERRLDRYLRGRGGLAGVSTHRVRTGETAWSIARDRHGLPTWVLAAYNPDLDLDHLRIGDALQVPVLADTVADLAPGPLPTVD